MSNKTKFAVMARINDADVPVTIRGRDGETLAALVDAGPRGITSLEAFHAGWAVRLAAYIHNLKTQRQIVIESGREPHDGGHHARYWLRSNVEILARSDRQERDAA